MVNLAFQNQCWQYTVLNFMSWQHCAYSQVLGSETTWLGFICESDFDASVTVPVALHWKLACPKTKLR